jgi:hypothetical protein
MVVHVEGEVLAHDAQADESDVTQFHEGSLERDEKALVAERSGSPLRAKRLSSPCYLWAVMMRRR